MMDWSAKTRFALEFVQPGANPGSESYAAFILNPEMTNSYSWELRGDSIAADVSLRLLAGRVLSTVLWSTTVPNDGEFHEVEIGVYSNIGKAFHNGAQVYTAEDVGTLFSQWGAPWFQRPTTGASGFAGPPKWRAKWDYCRNPWVFSDEFDSQLLGPRWSRSVFRGTSYSDASIIQSGGALVIEASYNAFAHAESYRLLGSSSAVEMPAGIMRRCYVKPFPYPFYPGLNLYRLFDQTSRDGGTTWDPEVETLGPSGVRSCSPTIFYNERGEAFIVREYRTSPMGRAATIYVGRI